MGLVTFKLVTLLWCAHYISGGYVPSTYYPSYYPTFFKQPVIPAALLRPVASPVSFVQVPQKQPLQLRPPARPTAVALPNARPPVVAINAEQQQQQNQIQTISSSTNQGIPVVAIQSQQQQRPTVPASPGPSHNVPTSPIELQQQIQAIPINSVTYPAQQVIPVTAIQAPPKKIVLPISTAVPNYSFGYAVNDPTTGDQKSHEETRTGDNVVGRYSVVEPDGTLRTVTYTAGVHGFNAVVERTPGYAPPNAPAKVVTVAKPVTITAPAFAVKPVQATAVPVYPAGFHFGG